MKNFAKSLKRQDGFTLVELMVVVAIIGLLSAVAIPNFKKYQAKAKISEAKLQLSAIYTAEASFFSDYNMYAACLKYMGYDPSLEAPNRYYAVGFAEGIADRDNNAHTAAVNSGLNATDCPDSTAASNAGTTQTWYPAGKGIGGTIATNATDLTQAPAASVGTQIDSTNMTFVAAAAGYISADNLTNANLSSLTIDQRKVLSNITNGY